MARWTVTPGTVNNTMSGKIDYDGNESQWQIYQNEQPFVDAAKEERENVTRENSLGAKKFATIPDIVAIGVMEKYGIDIHNPVHFQDRPTMTRFKKIIMTEYPYLVINNA